MNADQLLEYDAMRDEIMMIADRIIQEKAPKEHLRLRASVYAVDVVLETVRDSVEVCIHYFEDWGQAGTDPCYLNVSLEEFCNPKYLLDIIEEN